MPFSPLIAILLFVMQTHPGPGSAYAETLTATDHYPDFTYWSHTAPD